MKSIMYLLLFFLIASCSFNPSDLSDAKLQERIEVWLDKNPRLSPEYKFEKSANSMKLIFEETSEVGSPVLEKISSENLVFHICKDIPSLKFDSLKIGIILNPNLVEVRGDGVYAVNYYSYSAKEIREILSKLGNEKLLALSNYISFELLNSDELELFQASNTLEDTFEWYQFNKASGLLLVLDFATCKHLLNLTNASNEMLLYEKKITALEKILGEAEMGVLPKLSKMLRIINFEIKDTTWEGLDDSAKRISLAGARSSEK